MLNAVEAEVAFLEVTNSDHIATDEEYDQAVEVVVNGFHDYLIKTYALGLTATIEAQLWSLAWAGEGEKDYADVEHTYRTQASLRL